MALRAAASILVPVLALGGTLAGVRMVEANQARTGKTALFERARAWQATLASPRGTDPRAVSDYYAEALVRIPDLRSLSASRLESVSVDRAGRKGVTTHVLDPGFRGRVRGERASLTWARHSDADPWRIAGIGRIEDDE